MNKIYSIGCVFAAIMCVIEIFYPPSKSRRQFLIDLAGDKLILIQLLSMVLIIPLSWLTVVVSLSGYLKKED